VGIHRLLHSSCCFLNTNTAITRQLVRKARTLEAEWWQVCGEAWVRGQRKMSQVLGAFGLLGFIMLGPVLAWRVFWNLWTAYFFNFPIFYRAAVNRGYWIRGYGGPLVRVYTQPVHNRALHTYINVCIYTHPHWELLHQLCSWTGHGSEGHHEDCWARHVNVNGARRYRAVAMQWER